MRYEGQYFAHYQKLDATTMGGMLTQARIDLVNKHFPSGIIVDIGIGGGRFVEEGQSLGYDVCDDAVTWLKETGRYRDPYNGPVEAITCWDSLEHIPEPEKLLAQVTKWLFVSLPVFDDMESVLESKHYKPGEHLHYWSVPGFLAWCADLGFECQELNFAETELGREGIASFAFKRVV